MAIHLEENELVVGKYYWVGFYVGPPAVLKYEGLQWSYPTELKHDRESPCFGGMVASGENIYFTLEGDIRFVYEEASVRNEAVLARQRVFDEKNTQKNKASER